MKNTKQQNKPPAPMPAKTPAGHKPPAPMPAKTPAGNKPPAPMPAKTPAGPQKPPLTIPPPPPASKAPPVLVTPMPYKVLTRQQMAMPNYSANYRYSREPATVLCQFCLATVTTSTYYESGLVTWAIVGLLAFIGCIVGCFLIPCYIKSLKDVEHRCPNCNNVVGYCRVVN